ncbi:T9SS type A sorting domain-containing protein [Flavobacterium sp. FlaQc-48]|uniref:T9SS type A sorting domain-containing protein n=1 Tax=Flavobacterium sp. FlaQc-48 TaxID=3374181 RepID=UPI003757A363
MRKLYSLLLFLFVIVQIQAKITAPDSNTNTFIPAWKTNNSGLSNDTLITIPISAYNYDMGWNNDVAYDRFGLKDSIKNNYDPAILHKVPVSRVLPIYAITPNADGVVYVKKGAAGDGSSWASATGELADALLEAVTNTSIKQIWVAGGTYYPKYAADFSSSNAKDKTFLMQANVKIYGGFAGTETALASRDLTLTTNKTTLSGFLPEAVAYAYHVVVMAGAAGSAELNGFTITGGFTGSGSGNLIINGNMVARPYGAGMQLVSASPVLANLEFIYNTGLYGGALALFNGANASVNDVVFKYNTATYGGAVYISNGNTSVFDRVIFSGNTASIYGGAMALSSSVAPVFKNVQITGNSVTGFSLAKGGGVYISNNSGYTVTFLNTVLSGNASPDGTNGTIFTNSANIDMRNCIMYGNSHGILSTGGSDPNTVVYSLVQGIAADANHHILDGSSEVSFVNAPSYTTAPFSGGDFRLSSGSVGIDAGSNSLYSGLTASSKDLAGNPRVYNYNNLSAIDIGAYEYQRLNTEGIIYVNTNATGTGTGSSWTNAVTNLGEALRMAQTLNTSTAGTVKQIWVAGGTYYPKYAADFSSADNRDITFLMQADVKIYGGFAGTEKTLANRDLTLTANKTILSGDLGTLNTAADNAYHVVVMTGEAGTAELNGFTITGGYANGSGTLITTNGNAVTRSFGGGMHLASAAPVLANLEFISNMANSGGALALLTGSNASIQDAVFKNNTATFGGAVTIRYGNTSIFDRVTFSGNSASSDGGAINLLNSVTPAFKNVQITGNKATRNGGAVFIGDNMAYTIIFLNTVFSGNASSDGTIFMLTANVAMRNSIMYGNSHGISPNGISATPVIVYSLVQGVNANLANNTINGSIDPLFVSPNAYSNAPSNAGNYALKANSPVVNKGSNSLYNGLDFNTKDLAGNPRVLDYANAGIIDIGAYESQVLPLVTSAGAQTNLSCNGDNNGSATVNVTGGTASYSYSWNTNPIQTTATASNLTAGTYTVTVTDALNTIKTQSFTITEPTALTVTPTQTDVTCNGSATGSATVNVSGGTGTYTYSWNTIPVQTSATATALSAGTYIVTIKDANNCSTTQSFTITEPTALSVTPTQTDVNCNGSETGSATVNVSGGTGSYSYSWNTIPVQTSATATALSAGTYIVTIKDANNCSTTESFIIIEPTALTVTPTQTDVTCNGSATGSATVNVSGGTGSYSYSWNTIPVQTSATATALSAGTYIVTIKDANNCSTTESFTITEPTALRVTPTQTDVSCNGSATGSATVNVSGGTGTYSYSWNTIPVQTSATATVLSAGTYIVTIKDANNCSTTQSFTITEPTALTVTPTQTDVSCNGSETGSATVNVSGGTGTYSYSWNTIPVQTSATATALSAGTYIVTIKDANNCSTTESFTIIEPTALTVTPTQTDVSCNGSATGSATVSVSGGTGSYSYSWNTIPVQTSATATALSAGTYIVTVKDANNCSTTQSFTITEPTALSVTPTQTDVSCNGSATGSATVNVSGGTGTYSYSWNTIPVQTSATATALSAGTYIVTIKDANNCSTTESFTIIEPTALTVTPTQTDVTCNGSATGSATVNVSGGTGSYSYSWNTIPVQTSATATALSAGTYIVTIKDANNCLTTESFTITEPTVLTVIPTQTDVTCNGSATGSATVNVSGGTGSYSYSWNTIPVQTSATATALSAGTYIVTVKDTNNCSTTQSFIITEPTALRATPTQTDVSCNGSATGSATVNVSGGTGTYTYSWNTNPIQTSATATALSAGTYIVTIKDANNCSTTQSFNITQPDSLTTVKSQNNVSCYNGNNGSATVNVAGGISPYTYSWAPFGGNSNTAAQLTAGSYTVTITDANSCTTNETIVILQPLEPVSLKTLAVSNITIDSVMLSGTASSDVNNDNGQCLTERGFVYALHSMPLITDNKINTGSSLGTYSSSLSGLKGNTTYYVRTYAINAAGFINYGDEISFTTKQYILYITALAHQTKIYGNVDPDFNYTVSGFANGDTNAIISGSLSREIGENAGKYNITIGSINAGPDYIITFTGTEFEIMKADQVITWNQSLEFGCNNDDKVNLNASSSSGLLISYTIANPVIGLISEANLQIINSGSTSVTAYQNGDQNHNPAAVLTKPLEVTQSGLISQKWEDVLFSNNKSTNFVFWQWYKNGNAVSGANRQYYSETQPLNGSYYVIATDKDGKSIKSCPLDLTGITFSKKIRIYPNPVKPLNEFTFECDFNESQLNGAQMTIFDSTGKLVQTIYNVKTKNQITAPNQAGVYVIMLKLSNGEQKTINILVK